MDPGGGGHWFITTKKRKFEGAPPITVSNRYGPLDSMELDDPLIVAGTKPIESNAGAKFNSGDKRDNGSAEHKPPPLIISGVTNYDKMLTVLNRVAGEQNFHCKTQNDGDMRILPKTVEAYKELEKYLETTGVDFHTYQIKSERTFDVVLHGLHRSYDKVELTEILTARGYNVKKVSLMQRSVYDRDLQTRVFVDTDKFLIHLFPNEKNKTIYDVTSIDQCIVHIEPRHVQSRDIVGPQCTRCWRRGHTKNFCKRSVTCGICTEDHWTSDCKQPKTTIPRCANCGANHTANWKGCIDYQAKLRRRKQMMGERSHQREQTNNNYSHNDADFVPLKNSQYTAPQPSSGPSYLEVTNDGHKLEQLIRKQMEQTDRLITMMSSILQLLQKQCSR